MKKEMKVWIIPLDIKDPYFYVRVAEKFEGDTEGFVEATLIINMPEKKITITETDFDKIFLSAITSGNVAEAQWRLKKEFFGEKGEK